MDAQAIPTKGNLLYAKNALAFSQQGFNLLEQKRKVLMQETLTFTQRAAKLRLQLDEALAQARTALSKAIIEMGSDAVAQAALAVPIEESVQIYTRRFMGVAVTQAAYENTTRRHIPNLFQTTASLDKALIALNNLKDVLVALSSVQNTARILAEHTKKTNKRANALKNITIPMLTRRVKLITESLEERERDDFTRLKIIQNTL
jgi:V/A-type H+-transporting ATPase subunit D